MLSMLGSSTPWGTVDMIAIFLFVEGYHSQCSREILEELRAAARGPLMKNK